jgi:hypothetical protein
MWRPTSPDDYEFSEFGAGSSGAVVLAAWPKYETGFGIIGTTGGSGSPGPASFEWEHIRYVEYIGNIDNITHSHVDVVGMSHIRNSLPSSSSTDNAHQHLSKAVKEVEDSIGESLPAAAGGAMAYKHFATGAAEEAPSILGSLEAAASSVAEFMAPIATTLGEVGAMFL